MHGIIMLCAVHKIIMRHVDHEIINPRRMREGYGSRFVCVCVSVCYRTSCYIPRLYVQLRHHRVPCRLLKLCIVWISLKILCSGDMA